MELVIRNAIYSYSYIDKFERFEEKNKEKETDSSKYKHVD